MEMKVCLILALYLVSGVESSVSIESNSLINDAPIIGILSQEYKGGIKPNSSIIAASYVKYLESAGARVVPILINQDASYYERIVNYTNGVLFPGGGEPYYEPSSAFGQAGKRILRLANEANDRGDYYPLWGTCLGFELLSFLVAGNKLWLKACNAEDLPLPLQLEEGHGTSRLFKRMPADVKSFLTQLPVTINYHQWCLTPENFTKSGLDQFFRVLSTNRDSGNVEFVSTVEAISYPYYGVMWHPEKNVFEFGKSPGNQNTPHSYEAVRVTQHFANFFVNEARKSRHSFPDPKSEEKALIYNYNPIYTAPRKSKFEQEYFFPLK